MNRRGFLGAAAALGASLAGYAGLVEPRLLATTQHAVRLSAAGAEPAPAPPEETGRALTVVQLSDLHLKRLGDVHERLARRVDAARPDLLLFTGDTVDDRENLPLLGEFLALLRSGAPRVAVMGNWEYWGGVSASDLAGAFERAGGEVLVNRSAVHAPDGREILLTGVDDFAAGRPDLGAALRGTPAALREAGHHILLSHCPGYRDGVAAGAATEPGSGADRGVSPRPPWMISGHTHGGQVDVFGVRYLPTGSGPYVEGWYRGPLPHLYVSRGIGTSVVPLRLGARPEVAIFSIHLA